MLVQYKQLLNTKIKKKIKRIHEPKEWITEGDQIVFASLNENYNRTGEITTKY